MNIEVTVTYKIDYIPQNPEDFPEEVVTPKQQINFDIDALGLQDAMRFYDAQENILLVTVKP